MVAYLKHADVYYSESNQPVNIRLALRPLRELYSGSQVDTIGPEEWERVRQHFIDNGQTRSGINIAMSRALGMFKWGASKQLVKVDTYQTLKLVPPLKKGRCDPSIPEAKKKGAVDPADVEAIRDFVSPTIWAMVQVQLLTGARPGEICNLTTGDIDRTGEVWVYRPESHKNEWRGKERVIFIGPQAQTTLSPYLLANPDSPVFSPRKAILEKWKKGRETAKAPLYGKRKARIESNGFGGNYVKRLKDRYTASSYRLAIKRACSKANIETWTPYQLRHRAGQDARNLHGLEGTSARLGNSINAAAIYAEKNERLAQELALKCG